MTLYDGSGAVPVTGDVDAVLMTLITAQDYFIV